MPVGHRATPIPPLHLIHGLWSRSFKPEMKFDLREEREEGRRVTLGRGKDADLNGIIYDDTMGALWELSCD